MKTEIQTKQNKLDQLEEKINQLAQQIEKLEGLKQEEPKALSKRDQRIQALTAKLNSDLPEKRKIKIAEKLAALKGKYELKETPEIKKVENVAEKVEDKKMSKTEKQIQNLTAKLNSDLPEKRKFKIAEKLAALKEEVENHQPKAEKTENPVVKTVNSKVEMKMKALTAKLNSNLPEKRKVKIAEKLELLKNQKNTVEEKVKPEKNQDEKIQQFIKKLSDETISNKRKMVISSKLKDLFEKKVEQESKIKSNKIQVH